MNTAKRVVVCAVAWGSLFGCSDDDPTGPDDELSPTEWEALVETLFSEALVVDGAGATTTAGLDGPTHGTRIGPALQGGETFEVDETISCVEGGSVRVTGEATISFDEVTGAGSYAHELVQVHQGCRAGAGQAVGSFTLDGDPSVVSEIALGFDEAALVTFTGTEVGRIRWRLGERGGRCAIDLGYQIGSTLPAEPEVLISGSVCGRPVERSFGYAGSVSAQHPIQRGLEGDGA